MSGSNNKPKEATTRKNEIIDQKYEVLNVLGEGSFGRVYQAKIITDSTVVALKIISKGRRSNKDIIGLRRECEIQRQLHHDNIIQMLDSFETPNEIVVVTEFAPMVLNRVLAERHYIPEEHTQPIIWDLISALNYLHTHRILHRDLKPQNILFDAQFRAKLCDFGFARNMSTSTHLLTSIKGTPLYMAPELFNEQPYDYKADLWSLGCIMHEMLTGKPPFYADTYLTLWRIIIYEPIKWPSFVSECCGSFLQGLLQKDPEKRLNWSEILEHAFVKGRILICDDETTNKPLTRAPSANTLIAKEQQRKGHLSNKLTSALLSQKKPEKLQFVQNIPLKPPTEPDFNLVEENHPIEADEWIVFLQKSMEEVINGELTSLTQTNLIHLIVAPLRNTNTNAKVVTFVAKLLALPFAIRVAEEELAQVRKVYVEMKLVANLVNSSKLLVRRRADDAAEGFRELAEEDFACLECVYLLITHLVHADAVFLAQFCDALAFLNVVHVFRLFLQIGKCCVQVASDVMAILTHCLRVFPENVELIGRIAVADAVGKVNFVELLRHDDCELKERACFFLLFLGEHLPCDKMELVWNESARETLEALMYDSNESVRSAADRTVEELKTKEFYNKAN